MKIDLTSYRRELPTAIDRTTLSMPNQRYDGVVDGFVLYNPDNDDWVTTTDLGVVVGYGTGDYHAGFFDDHSQDCDHVSWLTNYIID